MANCARNIRTKNYQNLIIGFQVTVENVGMLLLGHSVNHRLNSSSSPMLTATSLSYGESKIFYVYRGFPEMGH